MELLVKKLKIKLDEPIVVLNRPNDKYFNKFNILENLPTEQVKIIIIFVKNIEELKKRNIKINFKKRFNFRWSFINLLS